MPYYIRCMHDWRQLISISNLVGVPNVGMQSIINALHIDDSAINIACKSLHACACICPHVVVGKMKSQTGVSGGLTEKHPLVVLLEISSWTPQEGTFFLK